MNNKVRCWDTDDPLYIKYHDEEWGVPVYDDQKLFEFLTLGGFQAGLSWELVLKKRESFRKAFDNFDPTPIIQYSEEKIGKLMRNPDIIRNRAKILATVHNAFIVTEIKKEYGSFSVFLWQFVADKKLNYFNNLADLPTITIESKEMSKELKKRGFKFVGPTICYAFMQAVGMVNDHLLCCFRYNQLLK